MKYFLKLLLLCMTLNAQAQFTQIQTNTTDQLNEIVQIGNVTLVTTFYNYVLKSNDDFDTFSLLSLPTSFNYSSKNLKYQNNKLYLLAESFSPTNLELWVSSDTGLSWNLLYDTSNVYAIDFTMFDSLNGIIYCSFYQKLITIDGGSNWQTSPSTMYSPGRIVMYNDSIGIVTTQQKIIHTTNRFVNESISSCYESAGASGCQYLNKDTIVMATCGGTGCYLIISKNAGGTWQPIPFNDISSGEIHFFNYNEGYMVGRGYILGIAPLQGMIKKTTDMGTTWTTYTTNIDCELRDIKFLNDSIALITGTNGVLLKWNKHSAPTGVEDIVENTSYSLAPNPATTLHTLTIQSKQYDKQAVCTMYDFSGRSIAQYTIKPNGDNTYKLVNDISKLANGMYYYKVQLGVEEYMIKFVITH